MAGIASIGAAPRAGSPSFRGRLLPERAAPFPKMRDQSVVDTGRASRSARSSRAAGTYCAPGSTSAARGEGGRAGKHAGRGLVPPWRHACATTGRQPARGAPQGRRRRLTAECGPTPPAALSPAAAGHQPVLQRTALGVGGTLAGQPRARPPLLPRRALLRCLAAPPGPLASGRSRRTHSWCCRGCLGGTHTQVSRLFCACVAGECSASLQLLTPPSRHSRVRRPRRLQGVGVPAAPPARRVETGAGKGRRRWRGQHFVVSAGVDRDV